MESSKSLAFGVWKLAGSMWLATRRSDVFDQTSMNNPADPRRRVEFHVQLPGSAADDLLPVTCFWRGVGVGGADLARGWRAGAVGGAVR